MSDDEQYDEEEAQKKEEEKRLAAEKKRKEDEASQARTAKSQNRMNAIHSLKSVVDSVSSYYTKAQSNEQEFRKQEAAMHRDYSKIADALSRFRNTL